MEWRSTSASKSSLFLFLFPLAVSALRLSNVIWNFVKLTVNQIMLKMCGRNKLNETWTHMSAPCARLTYLLSRPPLEFTGAPRPLRTRPQPQGLSSERLVPGLQLACDRRSRNSCPPSCSCQRVTCVSQCQVCVFLCVILCVSIAWRFKQIWHCKYFEPTSVLKCTQ